LRFSRINTKLEIALLHLHVISSHHSISHVMTILLYLFVSSNCLSTIYLFRCTLRFEKWSLSAGKAAIRYYRKECKRAFDT